MTSDHQSFGHKGSSVCLLDLEQIKDAVIELRASSPRSVLADLVEEKIRRIENGYLAPVQELSQVRKRRIAG